jgi:hypothetical protein
VRLPQLGSKPRQPLSGGVMAELQFRIRKSIKARRLISRARIERNTPLAI